jgi:hypothetical protein
MEGREALGSILRIDDAAKFMGAVVELRDHRAGRAPIGGWLGRSSGDAPGTVRMNLTLRGLCLDVSVGGIAKYLLDPTVGNDIPLAEGWCRRIGAERTREYLAAAVALFTGGEIIPDDAERGDYVLRLGGP